MSAKLKSYRELDVWQKAMELAENVYKLTAAFPKSEQFGLTSQIQRAAVSIPTNIAEGYARSHRADYLRYLSFAKGSLAELETQLTLAVRLVYIPKDDAVPIWTLAQDVGKMLTRLQQSLNRSLKAETRDPRPETRIT